MQAPVYAIPRARPESRYRGRGAGGVRCPPKAETMGKAEQPWRSSSSCDDGRSTRDLEGSDLTLASVVRGFSEDACSLLRGVNSH